jgi:hypothetical protein
MTYQRFKLEALVRHTSLPQTQSWRVRILTAKMDKRSIFVVYVSTGVSVSQYDDRTIHTMIRYGMKD